MTKIFPEDLKARLATRAVHAGQRPDPMSGAIMPPIYQTSTYAQEALGVNKGYEYARGKNPTREALERNVAALEGGTHGFAFSSGMGCLDSITKLFKSGDHIIVGSNVYGGTFRLFDKLLQNFGLKFSWIDTRDPQRIADAMQKNTVAVMLETPTNPLMHLTVLTAAAAIAKKGGALTIVDNTFATPIFQRPLELGADIVWHSATKYLNGHSDLIGGIAVINDDALAARLQFIANSAGAVPGPMDAWLTLRGTKTLALRMRQHDANGRAVADWLATRVGAEQVFYPGLASHPQHALAKTQMSAFGGMVSVETGSKANANTVVSRVKVFTLAESLGGVESLVCQPAGMTHASVDPALRAELGITDGLLRFSCGVEDPADLLEDLEQAFAGL
jgi:cystathionine beta-lyase/cystathionine gamma-synthase